MLRRLVSIVALASLSFAAVASFPGFATGALEDDDLVGYDEILNELNRESNRPVLRTHANTRRSADPLESVLFHAGIGLASLMQTVTFPDGASRYLNQKGIQASFGIDLFSPHWIAEGTARNFSPTEGSNASVSLQEFELKVLHKDLYTSRVGYRIGTGLSARYLNLQRGQDTITYTTPSGIVTFGIDLYANDKMSFGADLNGRTAMITDTPDEGSIDATLRIDFHL